MDKDLLEIDRTKTQSKRREGKEYHYTVHRKGNTDSSEAGDDAQPHTKQKNAN